MSASGCGACAPCSPGVVGGGTAYAGYDLPPRITWDPDPLAIKAIAPGEQQTHSVTLTNTGYLPILAGEQLRIVATGAIKAYVTVAQPVFPRNLNRGQAVTFNLTTAVPKTAPLGLVEGSLKLNWIAHNKSMEVWRSEALPVSIQVTAPPNQALLGPLAGADIYAYRLSNLSAPVEGPITANPSLVDPNLAGTFGLALSGIPDDEWILVTATGGQDIDADDDGALDPTPTTNAGTLHALARASDWRVGGLRINVLTEIAWQAVAEEVATGQIDDLDGRLRWIATNLLAGDVTGDGDLDYRDLTAFDPRSDAFRKSLDFPFTAFLAEDDTGRTLFDEIHDGQEQAVVDWIAAYFGDRLQEPQAPEIVDVVTEIQLPANRLGLQGQDLLISSAVSSASQILDQGATLMIAKDAAGHPVLLAFALPGEVARFSPRSTALALVMLTLGGSRDAAAFTELVGKVTAQAEFDPLAIAIENTLAADPFFLDRLMSYVDLVEQVRSVVAGVKAAIAIVPAAASATAATGPSSREMSLASDLTAAPSLPIAKQDFYCFRTSWPSLCSPWAESQPWDWYGDAKGIEALWPDSIYDVALTAWLFQANGLGGAAAYLATDAYAELLPDFTHVPFLAVAQENQTEIGLANPGAANYAFELITDDGSVADWFVVPRNSSLFDKLLNSGAAERSLYSTLIGVHRHLDPTINRVRFNRYPSLGTIDKPSPEGITLSVLNVAHLIVSVLNLASDFSAANKVLDAIAKNESALDALGTCTDLVTDALRKANLLSWWDVTADTTSYDGLREYLFDVALAPVMYVAKEFASPKGVECIGKAANKVGRDWAKVFGEHAIAFAADTVGTYVFVKIALDAANDTIPTVLSIFWTSSEQQDYYLTWDRDASNNPILVNVSTTPPVQGPIAQPIALFTSEQRPGEGLTVHFDASTSQWDFRATPSFTWDFGDGTAGSGELVNHTYWAAGQIQVRLTVDDGLGQTDEQSSTITVRNGVAPVIESMSCRLDANDARRVLIDTVVTDADGDLAELQWWREPLALQILPDESTAPDVTHMELTYPGDGIAAFAPTLRARDAAGNLTERTCNVFQRAGGTGLLNDTGITSCGDAASNGLPCPVAGFPGQDGESGRDVTQNDDSDGHAGFSFTKLDANGNPLGASATSWSCVRDNVTGLIWEVKTDDGGLRDKDWGYSWYNPDAGTNGGFAGYSDYGNNCFNQARCDTDKFVADVNAQGLCGASNWRLPDPRELMSIVSNDRHGPSIDTAYFPNTPSSWFWSSSTRAFYPVTAWYVHFIIGSVQEGGKNDVKHVRLVRGVQ